MSRIEQIEKMLAAEPDDVFLNFALAVEYVKQGMHAEALARFSRVSELDPNHLAAYAQRADVLVALRRREEARAALRDGITAAERTGDQHAADNMRDTLSLLD